MKHSTVQVAAVATIVAFTTGCVLPPDPPPPPEAPTRYYSAAAQMEQGELRDSFAGEDRCIDRARRSPGRSLRGRVFVTWRPGT